MCKQIHLDSYGYTSFKFSENRSTFFFIRDFLSAVQLCWSANNFYFRIFFHILHLKCELSMLNLVWMEKRWSRSYISIKDYLILIISAGDNSKMENIVINGLFSMHIAKQMNFVLNSVHFLKLTAHRELLQFPVLKNNGWLFLGWLTHQMSIRTSFCALLFSLSKFSVKHGPMNGIYATQKLCAQYHGKATNQNRREIVSFNCVLW